MNSDENRKQKSLPQKNSSGLQRTLQGLLERLREGLDTMAKGLRPEQPQPVPIPIPVYRPKRR